LGRCFFVECVAYVIPVNGLNHGCAFLVFTLQPKVERKTGGVCLLFRDWAASQ
jgi:hypothetical protein